MRLLAKCPLITRVSGWQEPRSVIWHLGSAELSAHAPFHEGQHGSFAGWHLPLPQCLSPHTQPNWALCFPLLASEVLECITMFFLSTSGPAIKRSLRLLCTIWLYIHLSVPALVSCTVIACGPQCLLGSECTNVPWREECLYQCS